LKGNEAITNARSKVKKDFFILIRVWNY